jgi:hypothetical protein
MDIRGPIDLPGPVVVERLAVIETVGKLQKNMDAGES